MSTGKITSVLMYKHVENPLMTVFLLSPDTDFVLVFKYFKNTIDHKKKSMNTMTIQ